MLILSNMESGFERINALVIARKRGFWTTGICADYFPKILLMSPNANKLEQFFYACRGLLLIFLRRPKILILGTSTKIASWYSFLRKIGFLKNLKIITDKQYIPEKEVRYMDKIIVTITGFVAIAFTYWFFFMKKEKEVIATDSIDIISYKHILIILFKFFI